MAVADTFQKYGHIFFTDVISKEMAGFMTDYMFLKKEAGLLNKPKHLGGYDVQCPSSHTIYGDPMFDTLLARLVPVLSSALDIKLLPAYTYARIYPKGEVLHKHIDRESCELSATMTLGISEPDQDWPMYIEHDGEEVPVSIPVGSMLFYKGNEIVHWRRPLKNEWQCQVFLHYVDANGPYAKDFKFDGRPSLGVPKR